LLVKIKRDIENQIRGLLKNLGLVIGQAKMNVFAVRAAELADNRPSLTAAVEPLLKAREAVERQIADLDRKVLRLARKQCAGPTFHDTPGRRPHTGFLLPGDDRRPPSLKDAAKRRTLWGTDAPPIRIRRD